MLVQGANRALNRFEVRHVSSTDLWQAVFPAAQPSTLDELRERFTEFLDRVQNGADPDRVRVLPGEDGTK